MMEKLNEGGVFMYFIFAFGVASLSLIVERYLFLYKKTAESSTQFKQSLLTALTRGEFKSAISLTDTENNSPFARVAKVGISLRADGAGDEEVQARMDEALSKEIHHIDRRTGFLAMFGNVATLIGLLGTISGMIHSFAAVANANPADRATMLSKGISEAMNCTAFGLIVAIPALVAYAFYQNKTDKMINHLTTSASEMFHDLLFLIDVDTRNISTNNTKQSAKNNSVYTGSVHTN